MQDNCIFCRIIAGEIPSATVYEDKNFRVIMDISPAAKGHMIMLSKRHCENLLDLDDESAASALLIARKLAKALKEELNCDGINLVQNNGKASGQTVFHFHIHLIPRYDNDQLSLGWAPGTYEDGEAASFAASLAARL